MKFSIQYKITALFLFGGITLVTAQKKDENIGTEVVNVVKPYTPTISDAFKVKETPTLDDEETSKKEVIKYDIFSFPVASTFTPSKGRAAGVDKSKQERLFKNYATAGFGNYGTAFAELYVTEEVGDNDYFSGMVKHLSSNGGINGLEVDDRSLKSSIDLTYGSKQSEYAWNADAGFEYKRNYWYGVAPDYGYPTLNWEERNFAINSINDWQTYYNGYLGGKLTFGESMFSGIELKYNRFWDAYDVSENRFYIKPKIQFDIDKNTITAEFIADYNGGEVGTDFTGLSPLKYAIANFGVRPSFTMVRDDWSFDLGASVFYSADLEHSDNKVLFYPNASASLKVVGDLMVFYVGADGGLQQNSMRDLTSANPFMSPSLIRTNLSPTNGIKPTDRQLDGFAGLKGKLSNYVSYNVRGSFVAERDKILFRHNTYDETILVQQPYEYGNSFGIVYDNVRTLTFFGELKADFSKNVSFGINGSFHKYTTKFEQEAWNLPEIEVGANLDVTITPKWYAGANLFFVGERKDFDVSINDPLNGSIQTLNSYFDANMHVGYKYSDRLSFWLRFNNIANQGYEKWLGYPVQSFQAMVGGSYKFDF